MIDPARIPTAPPCDPPPTLTTAPSERYALWRHIHGDQQGLIGLLSGERIPGGLDTPTVRTRYLTWPDQADQADQWLADEAAEGRDVYHCAHLLTFPRRKKEHAAPILTLWVDGDGAQVPPELPLPTAVVESSPGREQFYWRLTRPVPPLEAEQLNQRLANAMGGDKSGWDLSQLLRVPGTANHKYLDTPMVRLIRVDDVAYDPDELAQQLPPLSIHAAGTSAAVGSSHEPSVEPVALPDQLPQVDVDSLDVSDDIKDRIRRGAPQGGRSEVIGSVAWAMILKGYDDTTIAAVLMDPRNGISEKSREQGRDWLARDIARHRHDCLMQGMQEQGLAVREAERITQDAWFAEEPARPRARTVAERRAQRGGRKAEPHYIVQHLLCRGALTLLVGQAKLGKGTFETCLLKALQADAEFCGLTVRQAQALYANEDPEVAIERRFELFGLDLTQTPFLAGEDLFVLPNWEARVDAVFGDAEHAKADVIIIDPFATLAGLQEKQAWDEAVVSAKLLYIKQKMLSMNPSPAVLLAVHAGWNGNRPRGSSAFLEVPDITVAFTRPKQNSTRRVLDITPREGFGTGKVRVELNFDPRTRQYHSVCGRLPGAPLAAEQPPRPTAPVSETLGTPETGKAAKLWAVLPDYDESPLSVSELLDRYRAVHQESISDTRAEQLLQKWETQKRVLSAGTPKSKTDPRRYYLANG